MTAPKPSNVLTNSRLSTLRECAYKERLMYQEGWRPVREPEALSMGTLVHVGLEAWWRELVPEARVQVAVDAMRAFDKSDPYALAKAEAMVVGYDARWRHTHGDYEILGVEVGFRAPLINPETGAASRTWVLGGKMDVYVRERATERVLVIEHKTTQDKIHDDSDLYWSRLAMSAQVSTYYLGGESVALVPTGCIYDVLRKPGQRPLLATPPDARKYTKDGRLYAAQRETDETPDEYYERCMKAINEEPSAYYQRREAPRTDDALFTFLAEIWGQGRLLADNIRIGRALKNPDACTRFGVCSFFEHCAHGVSLVAHPELWQQVQNVHPELPNDPATPSTEPSA